MNSIKGSRIGWALARSAAVIGVVTGCFVTACSTETPQPKDNGAVDAMAELDEEATHQDIKLGAFAKLAPEERLKITSYLARRIRPETVRKVTSLGADRIHCVDELQQQGVLDEEARTGVKVTALDRSAVLPKEVEGLVANQKLMAERRRGSMSPIDCPVGTVPVRETTPDEVAVYGSLENYLKKPNPAAAGENYFHEANWITGDNLGIQGNLSLWDDYVEVSPEHTISQLWVQRGATVQSVEAGWVKRVGQSARAFTYVTTDGYATGCWNTDCGFTQTSTTFNLDVPWSAYSTVDGPQYDNVFLIFKSGGAAGNWFLFVEGAQVGYWPRSMFSSSGLRDKASASSLGGEIWDKPDGSRTKTDMGSGEWPTSGFGKSAYILDMRYVNTSQTYVELSAPSIVQDEGNPSGPQSCYSISNQFLTNAGWRYHMYYGGPGRNTGCCLKTSDCPSPKTCATSGANAGTCQ